MVNHAPFAAFGGWAALINSTADAEVKEAALDYISYVVAPEQSNPDVTVGATGLNPYRQSQLEFNDTWAANGWSQEAADLYLGPIRRASRTRTWRSTSASARRTSTGTCWRTRPSHSSWRAS